MSNITKKYSYTNGSVASATQIDEEFTQLVTAVNDKYSKAEVDTMVQGVSTGVMPDGSIAAVKVDATFGKDINISENPSVTNKAPTGHTHEGVYSPTTHDHNTLYPKQQGNLPVNGSTQDVNLATTSGWYSVSIASVITGNNLPASYTGLGAYGILIVQNRYEVGTSDANWVHQKLITSNNEVWERFKTNGTWSAWGRVIISDGTTLMVFDKNGEVIRLKGGTTGYMSVYKGETAIGNIGSLSGANNDMLITSTSGGAGMYSIDKHVSLYGGATNEFRPSTNGTVKNGGASNKWSELFAATGTINQSDRDTKQQIAPIPDIVLDAWATVNYCQFKFNDSVAEKGEAARFHLGLIAQEIEAAFTAHGLDAYAYGLLCYDEWPDEYDLEGNLVKAAGHLYSIRPDECQFLEMALMRRELNILKGGV